MRLPTWAAGSTHSIAPTWAFVAVALLLWAGLAMGLTPHWQQQADAAAQTAAAARAAATTAAAQAAAQARQRPLSGRAALPAADQRDLRMAALLHSAADLGLHVDGVAQRVQPVEAGVQPIELSVSARAGYSALRRFVEEALASDPGLALQQVDVGQQAQAASMLQAQLQFLLLQRVEPVP